MQVGDKVLVGVDFDSFDSWHEETVTKVGKGTCQCGSAENTYYQHACWPVEYKEKLKAVIAERAKAKLAYDKTFSLVIELGNEVARTKPGWRS